jgi:hypothetical protein
VTDRIPVPPGAAIAVSDLLDECAKIEAGQEVLIVAYTDGLTGGDNLVDEQAIEWIRAGVRDRGAHATILWADEEVIAHEWRFPPVIKSAMAASDVMINNTLDLSFEDLIEFKSFTWNEKKLMVRNFATTSSLLCTAWAQTPQRLVNEIRYRAATMIKAGERFLLTDPNGTHLEGTVLPAYHPDHPWFTDYAARREEAGYYRPWPEWMHPPINVSGTSGVFVFDRMLSWWSRHLGIAPFFAKPVRLTIDNNRILAIEGDEEAEALRRFLAFLEQRTGNQAGNFDALHFGVHPNASVTEEDCPSIVYRRLIEHAHTSNIHVHIGGPKLTEDYPYWAHVTGDIRNATFKIGTAVIHQDGHLTALEHPAVKKIAAEYPGRPGL